LNLLYRLNGEDNEYINWVGYESKKSREKDNKIANEMLRSLSDFLDHH